MYPIERHPTVIAIIGLITANFLLNASDAQASHFKYSVIQLKITQARTALWNGDAGVSALQVLLPMVTGLFLHAAPGLLIVNMVSLWMLGSLTSQYPGKLWMLGSFFVCGIGGFVLNVILNAVLAVASDSKSSLRASSLLLCDSRTSARG